MPAIAPERILRDLAELWTSLAHPDQGEASTHGVLRACSMTLIVAARDASDAQNVSETLGALMHEHPSRAIVLKPGPPGAEIEARVLAQCWMPFGSRQQICCEQIEITAGLDRLNEIPPVMYGLLAPDLPSVLWSRGAAWWDAPAFRELVNMIGKLIIDSRRDDDRAQAFARIRSLQEQGKRVADLAWGSVTAWRQLIAHALELPANRTHLGAVRSIRVAGREGESVVPPLYVAAWLKHSLKNASVTLERDPPGPGEVSRVILSGADWEISFHRTESDAIEINAGAASRAVVLTPMDDCAVMREELSITGRDPVFDHVFPVADQMAKESG
ncbi:MAG TPA: glucose-6-phosphate dehydrogenase assembly protein OpcA [Bryobacteraceae bacterium]|jgi:glucose-6-phosphate dehydrogenase assembly protein OpcA